MSTLVEHPLVVTHEVCYHTVAFLLFFFMSVFVKKKLDQSKPVCLRLKHLRESKHWSIEALAEKTKIHKTYLIALEECRFDVLPEATIYHKQFIRRYAHALGYDPEPFVRQYLLEESSLDDSAKHDHPKPSIAPKHFRNIPSYVRTLLVGLFVVGLFGYLGFQVKQLIEPPKLTLFSPGNGEVTSSSEITIQGETQKEVFVFINGKEIVNNENGQFLEKITLNPGVNTLIITAKKKHGKSSIETRHITLRGAQQISFAEDRHATP